MSQSNEERIEELDANERDSKQFQAAVSEQKPGVQPFMGSGPGQGAPSPNREPGEHLMRFFNYQKDPEELQPVTQMYYQLAKRIVDSRAPGPERTVALRHLLDSKTAALRTEQQARS